MGPNKERESLVSDSVVVSVEEASGWVEDEFLMKIASPEHNPRMRRRITIPAHSHVFFEQPASFTNMTFLLRKCKKR